MRRAIRVGLFAAAVAVFAPGCGGGDPPPPTVDAAAEADDARLIKEAEASERAAPKAPRDDPDDG